MKLLSALLLLVLVLPGCRQSLRWDESPTPKLHRSGAGHHFAGDLEPVVEAAEEPRPAPVAADDSPVLSIYQSANTEQVAQAIRVFQLQRSRTGPARDTAWAPFFEAMFAYLEEPARAVALTPLVRARVAAEFELDIESRGGEEADPKLGQTVQELLTRIDRKVSAIRRLRHQGEYNPQPVGKTKYCWPLAYGLITSGFGPRNDPFDRSSIRFHSGVDLAAAPNEPIHAVAQGIVIQAGKNGLLGNMVRIRHPDFTESLYAHLSRVLVRTDQEVTRGEVIGLLGNTGRSTGHHLHFGFYVAGKAVDPLSHLPDIPRHYSDYIPGVAFGDVE